MPRGRRACTPAAPETQWHGGECVDVDLGLLTISGCSQAEHSLIDGSTRSAVWVVGPRIHQLGCYAEVQVLGLPGQFRPLVDTAKTAPWLLRATVCAGRKVNSQGTTRRLIASDVQRKGLTRIYHDHLYGASVRSPFGVPPQ
jgi:hypothetical protein